MERTETNNVLFILKLREIYIYKRVQEDMILKVN